MSNREFPSSLSVHQYLGLQPGPKLLIFGAVHGNETCGTIAIKRTIEELEKGVLQLKRGTLTMIPVVNPLAYQMKSRQGERNLNRSMRITENPQDFEDRISNLICPIMQVHDVLLDLHSFHAPGLPFALFGPRNNSAELEPFSKAEAEEGLALHLGVNRFVEGWLETYAQGVKGRQTRGVGADIRYGVGTTETMRQYGGVAVTLECGQHGEENAPIVAYEAIQRTLAYLEMVSLAPPEPTRKPEVIKLYGVVDRLHEKDTFSQDWQDFQKVKQGEIIAYRHDGTELKAEKDAYVVFPNPEANPDEEWFYLAEESDRLSK